MEANKEIALEAIKSYSRALELDSELRNYKELILKTVASNVYACQHSLLKGYKDFDEIVEKECGIFLIFLFE